MFQGRATSSWLLCKPRVLEFLGQALSFQSLHRALEKMHLLHRASWSLLKLQLQVYGPVEPLSLGPSPGGCCQFTKDTGLPGLIQLSLDAHMRDQQGMIGPSTGG